MLSSGGTKGATSQSRCHVPLQTYCESLWNRQSGWEPLPNRAEKTKLGAPHPDSANDIEQGMVQNIGLAVH